MHRGPVTAPELPGSSSLTDNTAIGVPTAPPVSRAESIRPPEAFASPWSDPPPPSESDDPLLGVTLQKTYRITRILGEGGMGRVYEATHTRIDKKRFALKVLHPEYCREPEVRTRFQREAEAAASISHPNVVGVYDVAVTEQGWPFLVCEYLEGTDLAVLIKKTGTLPPRLAVHVILQVCDALIAAHKRGVIHRDLKPQNVFLVDSDSELPIAKVLDFGLSRFMDGSDNSLTKTGMVMGTPSYMAPEQARGERADHLTDIYGVGAMLYAAVTGRPPFNEESPHATLLAVMTYDPPRPHLMNAAVSVHLEMVIQRAMAKKPSERYQSMQALREAVASLDVGEASASLNATTQSLPTISADEANNARSQLILYSAVAGATVIAAVGTAITGGVYLSVGYWPFSRTEVFLSILVVVGTLLTPSFLLFRRLRRTVWGSTVHVLDLMQQLRAATLAALIGYGAAALAVRFMDGSILGNPLDVAWPGWSVLLVVVALLLGAAAYCRRRFAQVQSSRVRRLLLGPASMTAATLISSLILYWGVRYRASEPDWSVRTPPASNVSAATEIAPAKPEPAASVAFEAVQTAHPKAEPAATSSPDPAPSAEAIRLASDDRLHEATLGGLSTLLPLAREFPADPRILRAIAMDHGSRAAGLAKAMAALKQLFELDPASVEDKDLQLMVSTTSGKTPPAATLAYDLMGLHMGTVGTDLLYKLSLTKPAQASSVAKQFAKPAVRENFSPALAIALELKTAPTCAARFALLDRARSTGDDRSAQVLSSLSNPSEKGCGPRRRRPCPPPCPEEAPQFHAAIEAITKRTSAAAP